MNHQVVRPAARDTAPSGFTLAGALSWAGHVCPGGCPRLASHVAAEVWLPHRSTRLADTAWADVLVSIALDSQPLLPRPVQLALLDAVDKCVRDDRILVREHGPGRPESVVRAAPVVVEARVPGLGEQSLPEYPRGSRGPHQRAFPGPTRGSA